MSKPIAALQPYLGAAVLLSDQLLKESLMRDQLSPDHAASLVVRVQRDHGCEPGVPTARPLQVTAPDATLPRPLNPSSMYL
ncbi:MAG: hypothetical protein AAFP98_08630 [Pseudomonadota bacterium]